MEVKKRVRSDQVTEVRGGNLSSEILICNLIGIFAFNYNENAMK